MEQGFHCEYQEENQSKYYQILATVAKNKDAIEQEILSAGRP
ncbi:MAG: hypothetical protein WCO29_18610 [Nostocales cyanobacterium ELA583]|jgi:hypothetical protein